MTKFEKEGDVIGAQPVDIYIEWVEPAWISRFSVGQCKSFECLIKAKRYICQ